MKLREAKICLNCDEVFKGVVCPNCADCHFRTLTAWLKPIFPEDRPLLAGSRGKKSFTRETR